MSENIEPYIVIAAQEWELNLGSNARNLAVEFSKTRPVMYVNPVIDINTIRKEYKTAHGKKRIKRASGLQANTMQVADNLWVHTPQSISLSISWIKSIGLFNFLNKLNAKKYFNSLRKAIQQLHWNEKECIVFNDSMMFVGKHLKDYLSPKLNFYYIRDNLVEHPYYQRHGTHVEPITIKNANAIFANSAYLADYAKPYNKLSLDIGQGCELDMYDAQKHFPEPEDIASIPHPRIGYIGFLTGERLDITLLEQLADAKKDWQLVLIGPEEIMFQQSALHGKPNVHFLGSKKPSELPSYTKYLDVCLNPQQINPLTIGNYPRKIDEYLAMGKPTVATDTQAMKMFLPHVQLAVGLDNYIQAIEKSLQPKPQLEVEAAIAFAKGHTWKACVDIIYATQNQLLHA